MGRKDTPAPFADAPMHSGIFVDCISPERKKSIFRFGRKQVDVGNARRDQPDQILYLKKDPQTQIWNLERMENELYKEPPDPVLEAIAKLVKEPWSGSPTELVSFLQIDMLPNTLTKHLNVNSGRLLLEYNIQYANSRIHAGRRIKLTPVSEKA